eukprot:2476380-Pyramimonas_sp.AAC.1
MPVCQSGSDPRDCLVVVLYVARASSRSCTVVVLWVIPPGVPRLSRGYPVDCSMGCPVGPRAPREAQDDPRGSLPMVNPVASPGAGGAP